MLLYFSVLKYLDGRSDEIFMSGKPTTLGTMYYVTMEMAMTRDFVPEFAIAKMQHLSFGGLVDDDMICLGH